MISITFITAIVFIFLLLPYFTTITFLRWKGVTIRYSNSAAFGLETICFLPVIVVSHVVANLLSWGINLYYHQVFSNTSYRTFIHAAFDSGFKPNWSRLPEWLWYLGLFSIVHICLSVVLYGIIKKQITWSISERRELWRIFCLKWMRSFGVWNDFSEDISYCSIYDIRPIYMDLCLEDSGEIIYRGVLKDYSDIGSFKGIVLTKARVKRIYFNSDRDVADSERFNMLTQYPHKEKGGNHDLLGKVFLPFDKIHTLHHRIYHDPDNIDEHSEVFKLNENIAEGQAANQQAKEKLLEKIGKPEQNKEEQEGK